MDSSGEHDSKTPGKTMDTLNYFVHIIHNRATSSPEFSCKSGLHILTALWLLLENWTYPGLRADPANYRSNRSCWVIRSRPGPFPQLIWSSHTSEASARAGCSSNFTSSKAEANASYRAAW